jgi:hypothetical protein
MLGQHQFAVSVTRGDGGLSPQPAPACAIHEILEILDSVLLFFWPPCYQQVQELDFFTNGKART